MNKELLDGDRIFVIHGFLMADECDSFVERSERAGYDEATITTADGFVMVKDIRDNARLIVDDASLAYEWWQRSRSLLPQSIEEWRAVGFNERFRFYRYDSGQKFAPHLDGYFQRDLRERSQLTFMVYLNADYSGGETKFYGEDGSLRLTVCPERGMALGFVHLQLHEGAPVVRGRKYVLRTDVMYARGTEDALPKKAV
jgi:predicted 2-oxoglutarate/Fe(II)-dependent dioxygenase YbiX